MSFLNQLKVMVQFAFDNEEEFLKKFRPSGRKVTLDYFYMSSGKCLVGYNVYGFEQVTTITTDEYLSWMDHIKNV